MKCRFVGGKYMYFITAYSVSQIGNVFQADLSLAQSALKCLLSQSSSELWKWHMRFGHLSFDLLC
jgi:hypothetical protein